MNLKNMMKVQAAWKTVNENHPKLLPFIRAVEQDGITADTIIEVTVKTPQGKERTANIRVKQSDVDLIRTLKQDR